MKYTIYCLSIITLLLSCINKQENKTIEKPKSKKITMVTKIHLLPFEDVSVQEIEGIKMILEDKFNALLPGKKSFAILNNDTLPQEAYLKNRDRYKSSIILNYERKLIKEDEIIIGITHKDICADVHKKKDYGIIGRSMLKKQVCIVSDKRLSNKTNFWKPIIHEFIHTYYGVGHCNCDDSSCLMQDCKGKGNFNIKDSLCYSCQTKLSKQSHLPPPKLP